MLLRPWFDRLPLRRKLLVLLLLGSALPLALGIGTMFLRTRALIRSDAVSLLAARADQLAVELDAFHELYSGMAARLAGVPLVARASAATASPSGDLPDLQRLLQVYLQSDRRLRGVALLNASGRSLASTETVPRNSNLSGLAYFQAAMSGHQYISDIFLSPLLPENAPVLVYAAPVFSEQSAVVGVVVVTVQAGAFWDVIRAANGRAGLGSFSVLYDGQGIRIAHSFNEAEVFRPAGPLPPDLLASLIAGQRFGRDTRRLLETPSVMEAEFTRALKGAPPRERYFTGTSPANNEVNLGVTKRLRATDWTLFCLVPEAALEGPVSRLALSTAAGGAILVIVALSLGLALAGRIVLPIDALMRAATAMRAGDRRVRVTAESDDEVGALARAFNDMAVAVATAHDTLEERVRDRTAALEQANQELQVQKNELVAQKDELRRQQEELQVKGAELERASRMKSEFLANMSHELRTPLNAVIGFSELLLGGAAQAKPDLEREFIGHVLASGRHLLALINDILDLSKIEAGALRLAPEDMLPEHAVRDACALVQASAREKRLQIDERVVSSRPVRADAGKVRQILLNLLSNAIKFSPAGAAIEVRVEVEVSQRFVRFQVVDHGPGMNAELLGRLFEPFVQGEDPMVKKHQGTGLGLAITRRLVQLHGGEVTVESTVGHGSGFAFTLPVAESAARVPTPSPAGPLVLLVDSDPGTGAHLAARLGREGYRVARFDNGRDPAVVATELRPSAIVLDPATERRDGIAVLDALARGEATRDIPVVMSAFPRPASLLAKPFETQSLLRSLDRAVIGGGRDGSEILLIDDDQRVHDLLRAALEPTGYRLRSATRPTEGLALAQAQPPDAIIVDLVMPEMSGFEVVERLLADPRTRAVPIIVLTAAELGEDERARLRRQVRSIAEKGNVTDEELLAAVNAATALRDRRNSASAPMVVASAAPSEPPVILVVDDNDTNRTLARHLLERMGYRVVDAEDGDKAIAAAQREPKPALIFMDLAMPRKDGYTAARELKSSVDTARIPIVALTALAMSGDEQRAYAAGMDGYLTKPIDREKLGSVLGRFLHQGEHPPGQSPGVT